VSALARDISEYLVTLDLAATSESRSLVVAYHGACSLQHGQKLSREPKELLRKAGFAVKDVPEGHLCCGSAGTYNILQPELAVRLRDRKIANIDSVVPDVIAAGNVGCITQIASGTDVAVVHPVELIDWATGGPMPDAMTARSRTPERVRLRAPAV
jgi:glycolate dehydrogenase iron-sulfur subunit